MNLVKKTSGENQPMKILIVSANPLFGRGLEIILAQKWQDHRPEIRRVMDIQEANKSLIGWEPELIVLDYDDEKIDRQKFLQGFINGTAPAQVALVSLKDSQTVIVYDRQIITPSEAGNWLTDTQKE